MKSFQEVLLSENPALQVRCWQQRGKMQTSVRYSHWHSMMEIVYSRKGNGIEQINQTFYTLPSGSLAVIGPNQLHSFVACSEEEDFDLLVLQFDLSRVLAVIPQPSSFCEDWQSGRLFFPQAVSATEEMKKLLEDIYWETTNQPPEYIPAVMGSLLKLLVALYRCNPIRLSMADQQTTSLQNRFLLSHTFQFLSEHYQEEGLSVAEAAQDARLSITHFCKLFKLSTGMGYHEYLTLYRISQAEQLFHTEKSLTEIAFACGFGSISAFTRAFRRYRGGTPSKARKAGYPKLQIEKKKTE